MPETAKAVWHLAFTGLAAGFGAAIILLGAGSAIARLTSAALEGTARQPEAGARLFTTMIIPAAMIEGLGVIGLGVCYFLAFIVFRG